MPDWFISISLVPSGICQITCQRLREGGKEERKKEGRVGGREKGKEGSMGE